MGELAQLGQLVALRLRQQVEQLDDFTNAGALVSYLNDVPTLMFVLNKVMVSRHEQVQQVRASVDAAFAACDDDLQCVPEEDLLNLCKAEFNNSGAAELLTVDWDKLRGSWERWQAVRDFLAVADAALEVAAQWQ